MPVTATVTLIDPRTGTTSTEQIQLPAGSQGSAGPQGRDGDPGGTGMAGPQGNYVVFLYRNVAGSSTPAQIAAFRPAPSAGITVPPAS